MQSASGSYSAYPSLILALILSARARGRVMQQILLATFILYSVFILGVGVKLSGKSRAIIPPRFSFRLWHLSRPLDLDLMK
jgi:hypothetical protein